MAQKRRPKDLVRTDKWRLMPSQQQRQLLDATVVEYRRLCRALVGVIYTHWHHIGILDAHQRISQVERLIHSTRKNPLPTYNYFGRSFYKFPSYYRRAAIQFAIGQVSSFVTRYNQWQRGIRKRRDANPPRLNGNTGCYPTLYQGQCILFNPDLKSVKIKVYSQKDWRLSVFSHNSSPKSPRTGQGSICLNIKFKCMIT